MHQDRTPTKKGTFEINGINYEWLEFEHDPKPKRQVWVMVKGEYQVFSYNPFTEELRSLIEELIKAQK